LFLFFDLSVDRRLVSVVDYPRFMEENLEKYWDHDQPAQGILIGNAFRLLPLDRRTNPPFTDKVKLAVGRNGFGLLSTTELFNAVVKVLANPTDEIFKTNCRKKIIETRGKEIIFAWKMVDRVTNEPLDIGFEQ
jgi:hypothetical protein